MTPIRRYVAAMAVASLASAAAFAGPVEDCQSNCSVSRGSCDFDPSDSTRSSGCRQQADACKYECQLNGGGGYRNRPAKFGAIAYSPAKRGHGITYDFGTVPVLTETLVLTRVGSDLQVSMGVAYNNLQGNFSLMFEIVPTLAASGQRSSISGLSGSSANGSFDNINN